MTEGEWLVIHMAAGVVIGVLSLPWRFKLGSGSPSAHVAMAVFAWLPLLLVWLVRFAPVQYWEAWISYLRQVDRIKYQQTTQKEDQ